MRTIEENNRLIAEFIEFDISRLENDGIIETPKGWDYASYSLDELKFHTSFDWLMPVVSKCRIESNSEDSHWESIYYTLEECDLTVTYQAVIKFIEWYNENK